MDEEGLARDACLCCGVFRVADGDGVETGIGSLVHWFIGSLVHLFYWFYWFIGSLVHLFYWFYWLIGSFVHLFIGFIGSLDYL